MIRQPTNPIPALDLAIPTLALLVLGVGPAATAGPRQLNDDGTPASDVYTLVRPQVSPDGQWVVYVHDPVVDDADELYSVPRWGEGAPVLLSAPLPTGIHVQWFGFGADGARVVYLVNQETPGKFELWSVPIGGPAAAGVKISPPLPPFGSVYAGSIPPVMSPDGSHVVFYADTTTNGVAEVWSAPADGSGPAVRLSPNPVLGGGATFQQPDPLQITADSSRAVFTGDFELDEVIDLWSAPLDGSSPAAELSFFGLHQGADVSFFALTPDGSQALFLHDREIDERVELYRRPVAGGPGGAQLSPVSTTAPTAIGDVVGFTTAPDSSRVVFRADLQEDGRFDLWSVPLSGNQNDAVILSPPLLAGRETVGAVFSPDSTRVAFAVDAGADNVHDLWSAPADGSAPAVRLNPALPSTADVTGYRFTSDGDRVVYRVTDTAPDPDVTRVWTVPAAGPLTTASQLSTPGHLAASVTAWALAPGDVVLLLGNLDEPLDREVYSVPADGSTPRLELASSTFSFTFEPSVLLATSSGSHAVFAALAAGGLRRLYDVPVDGSAPAAPIDVVPQDGSAGVISTLVWPTPVGDGILFVGDYEISTRFDLWLFDHLPDIPEEVLFADGFESGTTAEWSGAVP